MSDPAVLGAAAGLAASAFWAVASVLYSRSPMKAPTIAAFKNITACILMGLLLLCTKRLADEPIFQADQRAWTMLGLSAIIGLAIGDIAYFRSLQLIGPRLGVTAGLLSPPLIAILDQVFLGQSMSGSMWLAIFVTLFGLGVVLWDRAETADETSKSIDNAFTWGVAYSLLNISCHCTGSILLKVGARDVGTIEGTFIRLFVAAALMAAVGAFTKQPREIVNLFRNNRAKFKELCLAAFLGTFLGVWFMLTAFKFCPGGVAATLTSTSPLFVIPVVWYWLGRRVTGAAIFGSVIAFAGVCWLLLPRG